MAKPPPVFTTKQPLTEEFKTIFLITKLFNGSTATGTANYLKWNQKCEAL